MATRFKVTAADENGVDQNNAEVLGEAFGRTFGLRKVAEIVRDQLTTDAVENGSDVTYAVAEVRS